MPRRIDTAFVEYLPDFSKFEQEASRGLTASFRQIERSGTTSANVIDRVYTDAAFDITAAFKKTAINVDLSLNELGRSADAVAEEVGDDFQRGGEVAERAFAELRRSAQTDLARIEATSAATSSAASKRFSGMAAIGGAAFLGIGAAATAGLGAVTAFGLMSAASLEQTQISFDALAGSAEAGKKIFEDLKKFAAVTPFEFPEVAAAAKRFLAFNQQIGMADSQLQGFLTTVGDLASVTGAGAEGMNRIVLAIGQMAGKGKIQLEELMQIGEAVPGFSAVAAIAEQLGITTAAAMEKISAGELDATTGINALLAGMQKFPGAAGAMEKQSQTLLGVFSTFKDTIGQALADSFAPAIPAIKAGLAELTPILGDAMRELAPALGNIVASLMPVLGQLVKAITPILAPILDALGPALETVGDSLQPLGDVLGELITALVPILPILAEFLVSLVLLATPILKLLVPAFELLTPVLQFAADAIHEFNRFLMETDWGAVGSDIGGAFVTAWEAVSGFFVGIWEWLKKVPAAIGEFFSSLPGKIVAAINRMIDLAFQAIGVGIGLLMAWFIKFPQMVVAALKALPGLVWNLVTNLWNGAKERTISLVTTIIDFVRALPGKIVEVLTSLPGIVVQFFSDAFTRGKNVVIETVTAIVSFIKSIPSRIGDFAMSIGSSIVNFIKSFLNRAIDGINSGIARVDDAIPGISLPRLPRLAHGGIAFGPAMIGEDSSTTPEAAIPLGDQRAMQMLRDALGGASAGVTFEAGAIIVNVRGDMSEKQASTVGKTIGDNIASTLTARGVRTAVRMA